MALADTIAMVRSGIFQIVFVNASNQKLGGGSAFLVNGLLVTNHHVFMGHQNAHRVGIRRDDAAPGHFRALTPTDFASTLVTGSTEQSYDYAVLRIPDIVRPTDHFFTLEAPDSRRIGEQIALLGFPLEHDNLTCHQGIISSFYRSGAAEVIQVDASVNAGNSGGPLIDPETGVAFGIVTRKATGLSGLFQTLRSAINGNIAALQGSIGMLGLGAVDPVQAIVVSQNQMLATLSEIERQANVGIGYAFSAQHVLTEPCFGAA